MSPFTFPVGFWHPIGLPVVSGLVLHLDADDAGSITKDGDNKVSQWSDLSTEGNHATQATSASQPLWVDNVLNGKPVIRFDGSDDYLGSGQIISTTAFTVIALTYANRFGTDNVGNGVFYQGTGSDDIGTHFCYGHVPALSMERTIFGRVAGGTAVAAANDAVSTNTWHIIGMNVVGDGTVNFSVDGVEHTASGAGTGTPANNANIGYWYAVTDSARYFQGDIAEILVYNTALTAEERQSIEQYLTDKWLEEVPSESEVYLYNEGTHEDDWVEGFSINSGSQSKQSNHLYLHAEDASGSAERVYVTDATVNLTNYGSLKIEWENTGDSKDENVSALCVSTGKTNWYNTYNARILEKQDFGKKTSTLDISGMSGDYYIRVHTRDLAGTATKAELKVYKVWLEE